MTDQPTNDRGRVARPRAAGHRRITAVPAVGWTTICAIDEVTDGDTVQVTLERTLKVRLLDCWAPEIRGSQREAGLAAKAFLQRLVQVTGRRQATLFVPTDQAESFDDVMSFGRVLGQIWLAGQQLSIAELMVLSGHATATKPG